MSDVPDLAQAHRDEIFEALIDAAFKGDQESFAHFNIEWERIDPLDDSEGHIRFNGEAPHPYTWNGYCFHCEEAWEVSGVVFGEMVPGLPMAIHMNTQCSRLDDCDCWSELPDDENNFNHPLCQVCEYPSPLCECDEGISLGPCALAELDDRPA